MRAWIFLGVLGACSAATGQVSILPVQPPGLPEGQQIEEADPPKPATSRLSAVTVYQGSALVAREVVVPEGKGTIELVVTPLPVRTIPNSLFAEGTDGLQVLSTRFRARAVREDTRKAVRTKEEEIRILAAEADRLRGELDVLGQNLDFLKKLENFTGATMQGVAEKGMLNGDTTIKLTDYVMQTRGAKATARVEVEQKIKANTEATQFAQSQLQELSAGSSRAEFDAIVVVDKANAEPTSVRLNYLVGALTWSPRYRLKAGAEQDPVRLESLAAIEQQSGEDWGDVDLTLSTAQPQLNATLPELVPLEVAIVESAQAPMQSALSQGGAFVEQNRAQARMFRGQAQAAMVGNNAKAGGELLNEAAALDQAEELLARDDDTKARGRNEPTGGPSVTHHLKGRTRVPSRREPQLVEVGRVELKPEFFAKAVPVLSPRVYRLAKMTNTGDSVILPGEATMYVGSDFVGRMALPQVAVGEEFTVGFGVDPQLQVGRRLVKKEEKTSGGNQVHSYEFRIFLRNFKSAPATVQVWDRLPKTENSDAAITLADVSPSLSADVLYNRNQRGDNLLRWDVVVPVGAVGEKIFPITYQFKMEYAKEMGVRYTKVGGMMEAPIGGMGGMGGGFRSTDPGAVPEATPPTPPGGFR